MEAKTSNHLYKKSHMINVIISHDLSPYPSLSKHIIDYYLIDSFVLYKTSTVYAWSMCIDPVFNKQPRLARDHVRERKKMKLLNGWSTEWTDGTVHVLSRKRVNSVL